MISFGKTSSDITLPIENNEEVHRTQFHENISLVVLIGQFFGVTPVSGITNKDIQMVCFKWKSLRVLYAMCITIGALLASIFCIIQIVVDGFQLDKTGPICFYVITHLSYIQFVKISQNWGGILKEFAFIEKKMKSYGAVYNLKKRFLILCILIIGLAAGEHILFICDSLYEAQKCEKWSTDPVPLYFGAAFPHFFTVTGYSHFLAVVAEIINFMCTFTWNFTDVFIMLISISLSERFKQIVHKLKANRFQKREESFWREIREDYNRLTTTVSTVNKHIATLILISYAGNTYFLCIQLYNSLKTRDGLIESVYFFYSFIFLFMRVIAVSMSGAYFHEETLKPLQYLHSVPSECYNLEIQRLVDQIATTSVGISGAGFFIVSKTFLLRMAGTIVTFELMIFEFGPFVRSKESFPNEETYICIL